MKPKQTSGTATHAHERWGRIGLDDRVEFTQDQRLNVIQLPDGRPKEVVLQDNQLDKLSTNVVLYKSDTEPGSSGSPVLSNSWVLLALHHAGGKKNAAGEFINNEGIRIDRIIDDVRAKAPASILRDLGL